jgi:CheY-like chemotaxis protein
MMPGMDGWSVLTALKANPLLADIPVVMVTITNDRKLGYTLGAADYLIKPVDPVRLAAILKKHTQLDAPAAVLIVEDDAAMREMTARVLKKDGWTVMEADNGQDALKLVAENPPSLIVLDLLMPVMDGFEFIQELRKHTAWQGIPVVVVTAKDISEQDRQELTGSVAKIVQKSAHRREELLGELRKYVPACLDFENVLS